MYPSSIYFGLKVVPRYFGAKVYTIRVHGPFRARLSLGVAGLRKHGQERRAVQAQTGLGSEFMKSVQTEYGV